MLPKYWTVGDRTFPVIAGGAGDPPDDDDDEGTGQRGSAGGTLDQSGGGGKPGADKDREWINQLPQQAQDYIRRLQQTAKGHSKAAQEAQEALAELRESKMTDSEKTAAKIARLEQENSQLKQQNRSRAIQVAFASAGRQAQALNPERLWRLVDPAAIEFDIDGNVQNAEDLVAELRRTDAYLFQERKAQGSADAGNKSAPKSSNWDFNKILRGATGRE